MNFIRGPIRNKTELQFEQTAMFNKNPWTIFRCYLAFV